VDPVRLPVCASAEPSMAGAKAAAAVTADQVRKRRRVVPRVRVIPEGAVEIRVSVMVSGLTGADGPAVNCG
jgi:hypothetical protein